MEMFFPPSRLDLSSEQLWREGEPITLRPKTFAVLRYLVEQPGKLVTKDELLDAVWTGTIVSDTVLKGTLLLAQESQKSKACPERSRRIKAQKSKIPSPQPLPPSTQEEAEACFHKAIDIACQQQAKSLELRASTSLARLWQQQGKREEAHKLLSDIYGWFTEGFDTADLQEAKALLEELL